MATTTTPVILMFRSPIGWQQVRETGTFQSKKQAANFITYNCHLLVDDEGKCISPNDVHIMAIKSAF